MIRVLDSTTKIVKITSFKDCQRNDIGRGLYIWRRGGVWLYIGRSQHGTERILTHSIISSKTFLPTDTCIFFYVNLNWDEIKNLENELIRKYRPVHNSLCNSKFQWDIHRLFLSPKPLSVIKRLKPKQPCPIDHDAAGERYDLYAECKYCEIRKICENNYQDRLRYNMRNETNCEKA